MKGKPPFSFLLLPFVFLLFSLFSYLHPVLGKEVYTLKFAGLAPEGTSYMIITRKWIERVKKESGGKVQIVFYSGGIMGDEPNVVRKIRLGQLDGGGFTGLGLSYAVPEVRVMELPFLFENYEEVDRVREKIREDLEDLFAKSGFVLLSWAEVGFIYLFSRTPVKKQEDLTGKHLWVWQQDPIAVSLAEKVPGAIRIPLTVPEMVAYARTEKLDLIYASPLALLATQAHPFFKYCISHPISYGMGGVLMDRKRFLSLPKEIQDLLLRTREELFPLISQTRKENEETLDLLKEQGLQIIHIPGETLEELKKNLISLYDIYPARFGGKELLSKIQKILEEIRR